MFETSTLSCNIKFTYFVASLFGMGFIGMDFMPAADKGELSISIELPKVLA